MIRRAAVCLCASVALLIGAVGQYRPAPQRYLCIITSASCGPCRDLKQYIESHPDYAAALSRGQEVRLVSVDSPACLRMAATYKRRAGQSGPVSVPAFAVVYSDGRVAHWSEGWSAADPGDLLRRVSVHSQSTDRGPRRADPPPTKPTPAATDETARRLRILADEITRLNERLSAAADDNASLRDDLRIQRDAAAASLNDLQRQLQSQHSATPAADSTAEQNAAAAPAPGIAAQKPPPSTISGWGTESGDQSTGRGATPAFTSMSPPTSDSVFGRIGTAAKKWVPVVATVVAPEFSGPVGIAVAVGAWWYRRRRRRPTAEHPATPDGPPSSGRRRTENHYVVRETDQIGEAYKEALRRIVAAKKSATPGIVDVVQQIEHVAGEIVRGRRINERPAQAPRPGIWSDPEEPHRIHSQNGKTS